MTTPVEGRDAFEEAWAEGRQLEALELSGRGLRKDLARHFWNAALAEARLQAQLWATAFRTDGVELCAKGIEAFEEDGLRPLCSLSSPEPEKP